MLTRRVVALWLVVLAGFSVGLHATAAASTRAPSVAPIATFSESLTFNYDSPSAATTAASNRRVLARVARPEPIGMRRSASLSSGLKRAAKGGGVLERLSSETGAVRFGARRGVPTLDRTGKVHGSIPDYVSPKLTRDELEDLATDLETSIGTRQAEQLRLGEDGPHRFRIDQERRFLRQVRGALDG